MKTAASLSMTVKRGPETWAYIYATFGFTLAVEGTVIAMVTPLVFPWNIAVYATFTLLTVQLFFNSGWFQNKLVGLKTNYEDRGR